MPLLGKLAFQGVGRKMESGQPSLLMAMVMMMMGVGVNSYPFCTENGRRCIRSYDDFKTNMDSMKFSAFHNYNPIIRPSTDFPDPVPIEVNVHFIYIRGLDAGKQELESLLDLIVKWHDHRMRQIQGLEGFTFKFTSNLEEVWHPHLIINGVRPPTPSSNFNPVKVLYNEYGEVTWELSQIVTTFCDFSYESNNPQSCDIDLGFLFPDDVKFDSSSSFSANPIHSYARYNVAGNLISDDKMLKIRLQFTPNGSG